MGGKMALTTKFLNKLGFKNKKEYQKKLTAFEKKFKQLQEENPHWEQ